MDQEQLERIERMEQHLNRAEDAARALEASLARFEGALPHLRTLAAYYESEQWRQDYDDDSAGKLPPELRRGVLAQDTVYDLLGRVAQLRETMLDLCGKMGERPGTGE